MNKSRIRKGQRAFSVFALFLFLTSGSAFAQQPAKPTPSTVAEDSTSLSGHGVGLGIGQVLLMGEFASGFSDGLGFNLNYTYDASPMFGLLTTFHYSNHGSGLNQADSLTMMGLTPNLKVNLAYFDKLILSTYGGFGLFKVNETLGRLNGSVLTFAFDLGIRANLTLADHFQFGTDISFHNILSKADSSSVANGQAGLTIGGTFLGLFVNVAYLF